MGWSSSGPASFLSSEPSSPAPTSAGECSMSMSLISNDGSQSKMPTGPCLGMNFTDFYMAVDQDSREGRGSISYTDYYSNEDGVIIKVKRDSPDKENMEEDEDHTLTLRQTEEEQKQNVQSLFDQPQHAASSYKKIGRFVYIFP